MKWQRHLCHTHKIMSLPQYIRTTLMSYGWISSHLYDKATIYPCHADELVSHPYDRRTLLTLYVCVDMRKQYVIRMNPYEKNIWWPFYTAFLPHDTNIDTNFITVGQNCRQRDFFWSIFDPWIKLIWGMREDQLCGKCRHEIPSSRYRESHSTQGGHRIIYV